MTRLLVTLLSLAALATAAPRIDTSAWISLTHPLSEDTPVYTAVYTPFKVDGERSVASDQIPGLEGTFLAYRYIELYEHTGTHIDAPRHFCGREDCLTEEKLEWTQLTGPAVVVDFSDKVRATGRNARLTRQDLIDFERRHGKIPPESFILLRSDWSKTFWNGSYFIQDPESGELNYPCITNDAVSWIVENVPDVLGVGAEVISPDCEDEVPKYFLHTELLPRNRIIIENMRNLHLMSPTGHHIMVFPMHMQGATGSPARIVALPSSQIMTESAPRTVAWLCVYLVILSVF